MGVCHSPGHMQQPLKRHSPCPASGGRAVSQALAYETAPPAAAGWPGYRRARPALAAIFSLRRRTSALPDPEERPRTVHVCCGWPGCARGRYSTASSVPRGEAAGLRLPATLAARPDRRRGVHRPDVHSPWAKSKEVRIRAVVGVAGQEDPEGFAAAWSCPPSQPAERGDSRREIGDLRLKLGQFLNDGGAPRPPFTLASQDIALCPRRATAPTWVSAQPAPSDTPPGGAGSVADMIARLRRILIFRDQIDASILVCVISSTTWTLAPLTSASSTLISSWNLPSDAVVTVSSPVSCVSGAPPVKIS